MSMILRLILRITLFSLLLASQAWAFDLSVSVSGGSGSWTGGKYKVAVSQSLSFTCTASNGSAPYSYSWNFDDVDTYKDGFSTSQNPSHTFNHLGEHYVTVDVTDDNGDTEKALLVVDIRIASGTPTINVTTDCGSYNLDNSGNSNVGGDLKNCVDDNYGSNGLRLYFPTGTYRFDDQASGEYRIGFSLTREELVFVGDGPGRTILSFYNDSTSTLKTHGDFFRAGMSSPALWLWKDLTLELDWSARGNSQDDFSVRQFMLSNTDNNSIARRCMFENVHITKFSSVVYWGAYVTMKRSNVTNFGRGKDSPGDNKPWGAAIDYGDYSLIRGTVWIDGELGENAPLGHSHIFYPQNAQYSYVIENYADLTNAATDSGKNCASLKKEMLDSEFSGNICANATGLGAQWGHNDNIAERLVCNDNRFVDIDGASVRFINTLTAEAKRNFFTDSGGGAVVCENGAGDCEEDTNCRSDNIDIEDNEWGSGSTGTTFGTGTSDNCSNTNITQSGGADTSNKYVTTDPAGWRTVDGYVNPGLYEYYNPVVSSMALAGSTLTTSMTSNGSGVGSGTANARFPYKTGAVIQTIDGSNNYSQLQDYSSTTTWANSPSFGRVVDVDGNISTLETISSSGNPAVIINNPTSSPTYDNGIGETVTVSGTCSDDVGCTNVTCANDNGTCESNTGSYASWSFVVNLGVETNNVTITGYDVDTNSGLDVITVSRSAHVPGPNRSAGGNVGIR